MFVYIWKDASGIPFYVGVTKSVGRTNPKNSGNRNWLCKAKLAEVGVDNVIVEIRHVDSAEEGKALEIQLIDNIGRVQLGNGTLTNLREGGSGTESMSEANKQKRRDALLNPNHPIRSAAARAKHRERMNDPEVKARFSGDNNPAKRPEVREKIKAKWQDQEFRAARIAEKIGKSIHSGENKEKRRQTLLGPDNPMRGYHKILNSDPEIHERRKASLRSAESRAKRSASMKLYWAKRKKAA